MKTKSLSVDEVVDMIMVDMSECHPNDLETDSRGELVFYTGLFRWNDNTYHNQPQTTCLRGK